MEHPQQAGLRQLASEETAAGPCVVTREQTATVAHELRRLLTNCDGCSRSSRDNNCEKRDPAVAILKQLKRLFVVV
jgi:hypothetical protein